MCNLKHLLRQNQSNFSSVLPESLQHGTALVFDLASAQQGWDDINFSDVVQVVAHTQNPLQQHHAVIGIGRYGEKRQQLASTVACFAQDQRIVHLGLDLAAPVGTPVKSPIDGKIFSVYNNEGQGNYGPTIILEHVLEGLIFYTLYGHLAPDAMKRYVVGEKVTAGDQIAAIGNSDTNGGWPPHLHIQIVSEMLQYKHDFPGMATELEAKYYLGLCPDPNLILNLSELQND